MRIVKRRYIGDNLVKGISGGEKKRVSIGCEMLLDPRYYCVIAFMSCLYVLSILPFKHVFLFVYVI